MVNQFEAVALGDVSLSLLDKLVVKFDHLTGIGAHHVIVMFVGSQFKHRMPALEVMAHDQASIFKLGQYPVNRRQADIFSLLKQGAVHVFSTHMVLFAINRFHNLEDLDAGQRDFQTGIAQLLIFARHIEFTAFAVTRELGYHTAQKQDTLSGSEMQKILAAVLCALLTACAEFPGVYKIDIDQGDVITQEMVDQLQPGMTKRQVRFIMGTPLITDTFNQQRWDYIHSHQPGGEARQQKRLTLLFDETDKLVSIGGDFPAIASNN